MGFKKNEKFYTQDLPSSLVLLLSFPRKERKALKASLIETLVCLSVKIKELRWRLLHLTCPYPPGTWVVITKGDKKWL